MKICIVGLGSIGQRHLRNIDFVLKGRGLSATFDVVEPRKLDYLDAETRGLVSRRFSTPGEIGDYDLIWITNPSQIHHETLKVVKDKARHFLVEKPVFTTALSTTDLLPFSDERKFYVACPPRHTKTFLELRDFALHNPVYSVRAICSSYLPDWRPGADYRQLYSAARESGGVKLDLIHEFDYLFSLFGFPRRSLLLSPKVSHLEIESPDLVSFIGEYPDKTVELHLDYFGRRSQRSCEVFTREETRSFDFLDIREDRNESYLREMRYFLDFAIKGVFNINAVPFANKVIDFVMGGS